MCAFHDDLCTQLLAHGAWPELHHEGLGPEILQHVGHAPSIWHPCLASARQAKAKVGVVSKAWLQARAIMVSEATSNPQTGQALCQGSLALPSPETCKVTDLGFHTGKAPWAHSQGKNTDSTGLRQVQADEIRICLGFPISACFQSHVPHTICHLGEWQSGAAKDAEIKSSTSSAQQGLATISQDGHIGKGLGTISQRQGQGINIKAAMLFHQVMACTPQGTAHFKPKATKAHLRSKADGKS